MLFTTTQTRAIGAMPLHFHPLSLYLVHLYCPRLWCGAPGGGDCQPDRVPVAHGQRERQGDWETTGRGTREPHTRLEWQKGLCNIHTVKFDVQVEIECVKLHYLESFLVHKGCLSFLLYTESIEVVQWRHPCSDRFTTSYIFIRQSVFPVGTAWMVNCRSTYRIVSFFRSDSLGWWRKSGW
jgi:hypothetical protein